MTADERVRALHIRQERYHDGGGEWSYDTAEEAADEADIDTEQVESFAICRHCGDIEAAHDQRGEQPVDFLQALWPCPTIRALDADQALVRNIGSETVNRTTGNKP